MSAGSDRLGRTGQLTVTDLASDLGLSTSRPSARAV